MAGTPSTRMLLVTANIASCFEQPDTMLKPWITEFLKTVEEHEPHFIALHCQEVGGKHYEESMQHVEHFVRSLMNRGTMLPYDKVRVFLDEEYESAEKFTALGNLYFIHQNVQDLQIWDFKEKKFTDCVDRREYSGNIEDVSTKEKAKFPQEFFPECKWSRKGFMRTRWCLNGTKFDLVNIHLFHDASNFIAMEGFPSVYSLNRKRALEHTLDRFHNDGFEKVPIFLFGDFNFRMNTRAVVEKLTQGCTVVDTELPNSSEKAQEFLDNKGTVQLVVSKKSFKHCDHHSIFLKENGSWLREFDQELAQFGNRLAEFPINFPPSYPFEEGADGDGSHYMQTRCPSWCDRIILDKAAKKLIDSSGGKVAYNIIGLSTTMGDHKPVSLCVEVPMGAGIVTCCSPHAPCRNFVHEPDAHCFVQAGWCLCQSYPPCPRPVVTSVCPNSSTPPSLPGQVTPVIPAAACVTPVRVDVAPAPGSVSSHGPCLVPQCVCSAGASEEKISHHCQCGYPAREPQMRTEGGVQSRDLLRNLLLLGGTSVDGTSVIGHEQLLKRVNSAPNTSFVPLKPHWHIPLAASHSLDTGSCLHQTYPPCAKLRLRASSSRLISHHSSSTEEWFEEVPVHQDADHVKKNSSVYVRSESLKPTQEVSPPSSPKLCESGDKPPPSPVSGGFQDMDTGVWLPSSQIAEESGESVGACSMGESGGADSRGEGECHSTKGMLGVVRKQVSTEQHSLNNLLLADSCDQLSTKHLTHSESSLSVHYSEDSVSSMGRPLKDGETVSQAPTFDIADVDPSDVSSPKPHIKCQKPSHKPNADISERPPGQCCCVVS
ncbi:uncharacterized protein 5PtaseI isoform X2 [Procambarus clarkii]|uniref:uncharacterized protein 5PtaseI isoform X2 n=1 Tax=Procambarus clarkii TaxID=6728 RepID=UPI001E6701FB|nr:uncharacterized protein LOC123763613 [Procambarus clarkii]